MSVELKEELQTPAMDINVRIRQILYGHNLLHRISHTSII